MKFDVVVGFTENFTVNNVEADSEDEAYEIARGLVADGEIEGENDGVYDNVQVTFDEDYMYYLEECESKKITPFKEDEDWAKHSCDMEMSELWEDYEPETDSDIISDLKLKKKFIKKCKERDQLLIRVRFLDGENSEKDLFLPIGNLRGNKYFYHLPFSKHITNEWTHQAAVVNCSIDKLLDGINIYDEKINELDKDIAIYFIEKMEL